MKLKIAFLFSVVFIFSEMKAQNKITEKDLKKLFHYMSGSFSSELQSKRDTDFYDVRLHMKPVWKKDGYWLYVEQAMIEHPDKPYRQRFYCLEIENDSTIISKVYSCKAEKKLIGDWKNKNDLTALTKDSLDIREGCEIHIHKNADGTFSGSTNKSECFSQIRGSAYGTSTIKITEKTYSNWDQGFSKTGKQVWGTTKGGYEFDKIEGY